MLNEKMERKTEKDLWKIYWETYVPTLINKKNPFTPLFDKQENGNGKSFLEIGGFPGVFAIWFHKFKNYDVSLLDFYTDNPITNSLLKKNELSESTIKIIETDLFNYKSTETYDLVFSAGFIEHFYNTQQVIQKHVDCLKNNGKLLITLPNLKGINGWIQYLFDKKNYNIHVIACMEKSVLKNAALACGLKNIEVYYYGKPMVWLEHSAPVNIITRKVLTFLSLSLKIIPFKGKYISPYLVIEADKINN